MDQDKIAKIREVANNQSLPEEHRSRANALLQKMSEHNAPQQITAQPEDHSGHRKLLDALTKLKTNRPQTSMNAGASHEPVIQKQEQQISPKANGDAYMKTLGLR